MAFCDEHGMKLEVHTPFFPYSVLPRQEICLEIMVHHDPCTGRIVLHLIDLKSVIQHCLATRFCGSHRHRGVEILDNEYFGSLTLCLIFFFCRDHVWNQSYCFQEYQRKPIPWRRGKGFFEKWFVKRLSELESEKNNEQIDALFYKITGLRGMSRYCVHYVWCLDVLPRSHVKV